MGQKTKIAYCDSTVNPVPICTGCEIWQHGTGGSCYAGNMIGRHKGLKGWPKDFGSYDGGNSYFPERIPNTYKWTRLDAFNRPDKPWLNYMPRIIFVNDMGDMFSSIVPMKTRLEIIDQMEASDHYHMVFTKNAKAMAETFNQWGYIPYNVMPVVSITGNMSAPRAQIFRSYLSDMDTEHNNFGISFEPLIDEISYPDDVIEGYDWVAIGGASKQPGEEDTAPMHYEWAKHIVGAATSMGVKIFVKQLGFHFRIDNKRQPRSNSHGDNYDYFPEELRIREMFSLKEYE